MLGNHQQALICCEKVLKIDKDDSLTHNYKGTFLSISQDKLIWAYNCSHLHWKVLIYVWNLTQIVALQITTKVYNYVITLGIALHHLNKYSESCKSYSKALQQNPNLENELINRGLVNFNILQATTLITNGHYTIGLSLIL